jgi:hypothetical protein
MHVLAGDIVVGVGVGVGGGIAHRNTTSTDYLRVHTDTAGSLLDFHCHASLHFVLAV